MFFSFVVSRLKSWSVALRSHDSQRNVDVPPCGVGVCTCHVVRSIHNGFGDLALQAWQADVKPSPEEVDVAGIAQVDFGVDGCVGRKLHLHLVCHKPHRANETGRPTGSKQLLRSGTTSWGSGSRELNV